MRFITRRNRSTLRLYALALLILAAVGGGASVAPGAPSNGLVAAYTFDAGSGSTVADAAGNGNTATISGATWTSAGKSGGALTFDGVNDWLTIADSAALDLGSGMTLEAWVKPNAAGPSWRTVIFKEKSGGMVYSLYSSENTGRPIGQVDIDGERNALGAPLPLYSWSHLAVTYDDTTLRLYVNGALASSLAVGDDIPASNGPLRIGGNSIWREWFSGQIDDVRVYNRALGEAELRSDMSTPVGGGGSADTQAPTAPTNLRVTGQTATSVTLTWTPSSDNVSVAGYGRYRAGELVSSGTGTSYTFTGLTCGTSHTLAVDAHDAAGNRSARVSLTAATSVCATPSGIVAAYSFDSVTGSVLPDVSGKGNPGAISGATWTSAGKSGGALSFDGVNDWVTIADSAALDLSSGMTLEAWVKPSATGPSWRTVLFKEQIGGMVYSLYASENTNRPVAQVDIGGERNALGAPLSLNAWTHLAATYDGATLRLYINATLASSLAVGSGIPTSSGPLRIGGNSVWEEWFAGQIDDVRVYNRALGATELQVDMNAPVGVLPPGGGTPADTQAPSAPSGLTASGLTPTSITLSWSPSTDNVGVAGYGRYRGGALVSSGTGTSYTFTGLACGTSYTLAVDAYDAAGNRSTRPSVAASTAACGAADTQAPTAPGNLAVTSSNGTSIAVSWSASTDNVGVSGYGAYRGGAAVGTASTTNYTFAGLACGSSYALAVDAVDAAGNRSGKTSLTASTSACSAPPPLPPPLPPPPPPPGSGSANVWVDVSGGSCVRLASVGGYVDAAACGSFDAAFDRASPGDTVNVVGGTYSGQALSGDKGSSTPVAVRVAPGQSVVVNGDLDITGDYVQVFGPITVNRVDIDDGNQSNVINGVVVSGVKAKSSFIENARDLTIRDSEFGPNPGQILIQIGGAPETHRLTLDNVYLHDNPPTASGQHLECIFSTGIQGLTIRNSRFQNCGYFGLLSGMCCGATNEPSAFVFENNHFGKSKCYPGAGGCPASGDAPYSLMLSRPVGGQSRIVNNYFETPPAMTGSFQQLTASGNTGAAPAAWR